MNENQFIFRTNLLKVNLQFFYYLNLIFYFNFFNTKFKIEMIAIEKNYDFVINY